MATNFLWGGVGSVYNLLTTELNTLANNSGTALGPEIDNTSNAWQMGRLALTLASNSLAFTTSSFVQVFFLPKGDATNYPTYTSGTSYKLATANYLVGTIAINPTTQSSNVVYEYLDYVPIPEGKFKTVLVNLSGQTLPSSGNTLNIYPTPSQY